MGPYRKTSYTGLCLGWNSFSPQQYKIGLECLKHRDRYICSHSEHFNQELHFVKSVLMKKKCLSSKLINSLFKKFLESKYTADIKNPVFGPQKKHINVSFPIVVFKAKNYHAK